MSGPAHIQRRWRLRLVIACWLLVVLYSAWPALANTELERLSERHHLLGWEAVGRVDMGRTGYCTGVLIAPELVLTAAHCLFDPSGRERSAGTLIFRAGLRDGQFVASRSVRRLLPHADYQPELGTATENLRVDAALLELATPVPSSTAAPFALHTGAAAGARVSVVSYGQGRDNAPSWQRDCGLLQRGGGLMAFDCDVTYGSSGAPVFLSENGERARVLSLISAGNFESGEAPVAFGMDLPALVSQMKHELRKAPVPESERPRIKRIGVGQAHHDTGAKFVRP